MPTVLDALFGVQINPIPFLDRTLWVFCILVVLMVGISLAKREDQPEGKALVVKSSMFRVSPSFIVLSILIGGVLTALYTVFW